MSAERFTCVECERSIIIVVGKLPYDTKLCGACLCLPGWTNVPFFRERIDPAHSARWTDFPAEPGPPVSLASRKKLYEASVALANQIIKRGL